MCPGKRRSAEHGAETGIVLTTMGHLAVVDDVARGRKQCEHADLEQDDPLAASCVTRNRA